MEKAWHKLQSRRALKVLAYLEDDINRACLLAWLIIVSSVMRLHCSRMRKRPQGYEPNLIFKLVDPAKSVVATVLARLTNQIFDSVE